ncbi:MAG TPA: hypothetical protein PLE12_06115 [Propionicimonas sp.]|nr:hypothetical protein [Propionicimonas sp.]
MITPGPLDPPGHIPGFHAPGTLLPLGGVYQAQQERMAVQAQLALQVQADAARAAQEGQRRRRHLLQMPAR